MSSQWISKRILITVRTYPTPAAKGVEVSCTAGITDDGKWIRLFPVPYRFLGTDKRFKKYQWIDVSVKKSSSDIRPESFRLNIDSINIGRSVLTANQWRERKLVISPLKSPSLCALARERDNNGFPTLGIFKPHKIKRLMIIQSTDTWTPEQNAYLGQQLLFVKNPPRTQLEKIPYDFKYEFTCSDEGCTGHNMTCTDWEIGQSYRKWRREYGAEWESKFRQRYEEEMINKYDTYFFVGTLRSHPGAWIIIGLFYPPPTSTLDLF